MAVIDMTPAANGYAQVLMAEGELILLTLHLDGIPPPDRAARVYFAIARGEKILFADADSQLATRRFDELRRTQPSTQRCEDYLESHPTTLPTLRGRSFQKLVEQLSHHLLQGDIA